MHEHRFVRSFTTDAEESAKRVPDETRSSRLATCLAVRMNREGRSRCLAREVVIDATGQLIAPQSDEVIATLGDGRAARADLRDRGQR